MTPDIEHLRARSREYEEIASVAIKAGGLTPSQQRFVQKYLAEVLDALPDLLNEVEDMKSVLAAIAMVDPSYRNDAGDQICAYCGRREEGEHSEDCPWRNVREVLGIR